MDFHQLNTFYHVARRLHFTRAAEDLNMSQPAVSRQIEALEKSLGIPLFNRMGRTVALTDAGYVLYRQGTQILQLVASTQASIEALKNLESGSLRVGCSTTMGNYVIPPAVLEFTRRYPAIQVHVDIHSTDEMLRRAEEGDVDLAFIAGPVSSNSLYVEPFLTDDIVLVMGKDHPFAAQSLPSIADLSRHPLLIRNAGSHSRAAVLSHLQGLGVRLPELVEFDTTEAIKQAILTGAGLAFMSTLAVRFERQCGLLMILEEPPFCITRPFYLVSHKGRHPSPAALAFKMFVMKSQARYSS